MMGSLLSSLIVLLPVEAIAAKAIPGEADDVEEIISEDRSDGGVDIFSTAARRPQLPSLPDCRSPCHGFHGPTLASMLGSTH